MMYFAGTMDAGRNTAGGYLGMYMSRAGTTTTRMGSACITLYAKTGAPRLMLYQGQCASADDYIYMQQYVGESWNNTADTVTSIKFNGGVNKLRTGTTIDIYSIVKI